jgi:hypothetical protein
MKSNGKVHGSMILAHTTFVRPLQVDRQLSPFSPSYRGCQMETDIPPVTINELKALDRTKNRVPAKC